MGGDSSPERSRVVGGGSPRTEDGALYPRAVRRSGTLVSASPGICSTGASVRTLTGRLNRKDPYGTLVKAAPLGLVRPGTGCAGRCGGRGPLHTYGCRWDGAGPLSAAESRTRRRCSMPLRGWASASPTPSSLPTLVCGAEAPAAPRDAAAYQGVMLAAARRLPDPTTCSRR